MSKLDFDPTLIAILRLQQRESEMNRLAILCVAAAASAGLAQALADPPARKTREGEGDTGQIVCKSAPEIGSRLRSRRVCRTRAEWAELQAQSRDVVDEVQRFKPVICNPDAQGGWRC